MDYEALSLFVSKPVPTWTLLDINKWLHFIHMEKLFPLFGTFDPLTQKITASMANSLPKPVINNLPKSESVATSCKKNSWLGLKKDLASSTSI